MNGVSKKLTVAGIGVGSLVAVIKTQPTWLAYIAVIGIVVITLAAISTQAYLDSRKPKEQAVVQPRPLYKYGNGRGLLKNIIPPRWGGVWTIRSAPMLERNEYVSQYDLRN